MFKQPIVTLFTILLFSSFSFAQGRRNTLTQWEYLEVSGTKYSSGYYQITRYYRDYNFLTSAANFAGQNSLEWIKDSGWELVGVVNNGENPVSLFFKRPFNKTRTENEIARLKKNYETESQMPVKQKSSLIDLDEQEFQQKLADYNKSEEVNLTEALAQIKNFPLQIISVQSKSSRFDYENLSAEIVLDATSVLLKNGKSYRSSEAEKYYQDFVKQITENLRLMQVGSTNGIAQQISEGLFSLRPIGKTYGNNDQITIYISVIVNADNKQNIVAQGTINAHRTKEK